MKLKNYAIVLSILTAVEVGILILRNQDISITEGSISRIGNLDGNYLFYVLATSILIIMFSFFLHKLYHALNHKPKKALYFIAPACIAGLLFKVTPELNFGRITHILLFITAGILTSIVVGDFNRILYTDKNKSTRKTARTISRVAIFGTVVVLLVIGMNVITELVYIGAILSWTHMASSSI